MKLIYSSQNSLVVDNLRNVLEQEEIECIVKNRQLTTALGEVPPIEAWLELWIYDDADAERAEKLVADVTSVEESKAFWRCEKCGEQIPSEIGACWKCAEADAGERDREPLPGGLLYRAMWRRITSSQAISGFLMAAMIAGLLYMLLASGSGR